jgi:hypothetical protein
LALQQCQVGFQLVAEVLILMRIGEEQRNHRVLVPVQAKKVV